MKSSHRDRIKRLEDQLNPKPSEVPQDVRDYLQIRNNFDIIQRAADKGNVHALARLEVLGKLFEILKPSFKTATEIISKIPGGFRSDREKYHAWWKEMDKLDTRNFQLFLQFCEDMLVSPDGENLEEYLLRPFVDEWSDCIRPVEAEPPDGAAT